jgi:hypothetical protein
VDTGPHRTARPNLPRILTEARIARAAVAVLATAVCACTAPSSGGDTSAAALTTPSVSTGGPAPLPVCAGTGHWESCTIFDRLERAGLAPQRGDTIRVPFLHTPGQSWKLGPATIHVFRYRDSTARRTDSNTLDSLTARPRGDTLARWTGTPTLILNDNLLAVLLSDNEQQIERVSLALTAGPPPKADPAAPHTP